ncbi:MAG: efflux transporter periplasmic adaptor subunit [Saprospirales bacterium]|nr:efflux transporter periplasmic adaptor subunit [Saprospirales bacterium]
MTTNLKSYFLLLATGIFLASCGFTTTDDHAQGDDDHAHGEAGEEGNVGEEMVTLTQQQFDALGIRVDTLPSRKINNYVLANGQLKVPPQAEAAVTATIGANIALIKVIEGDRVRKGQILAYMKHPNLVTLQTDYLNSWNQLNYLEQEYKRQKKLYEKEIGAGKEYQKAKAEYQVMKGTVEGLAAQLKLLNLNTQDILDGKIAVQVPVVSPINGHIQKVKVKTGQYVEPQTELFDIVNIDDIHADLMVFEKDIHKVKKGQKVRFTFESLPYEELEAVIFAVGKSFEQDPKALHLHAEIDNKKGLLIPGMYVHGRILTDDTKATAIPESALVRDGDRFFIFSAEKADSDYWRFKPVEVVAGNDDDGWVEIKLLEPLPANSRIAWNNAYYLLAEMKKEETEHSH